MYPGQSLSQLYSQIYEGDEALRQARLLLGTRGISGTLRNQEARAARPRREGQAPRGRRPLADLAYPEVPGLNIAMNRD